MKVTSAVTRLLVFFGYLLIVNVCRGQHSTNTSKVATTTAPPGVSVIAAAVLPPQHETPASDISTDVRVTTFQADRVAQAPYSLYIVSWGVGGSGSACPSVASTVTISCGSGTALAWPTYQPVEASCRPVGRTLACTKFASAPAGSVIVYCLGSYGITASLASSTLYGCQRNRAPSSGTASSLVLRQYCDRGGVLKEFFSNKCGGGGYVYYINGKASCLRSTNTCLAGGTSTKCPMRVGSLSVSNSVNCILYKKYDF